MESGTSELFEQPRKRNGTEKVNSKKHQSQMKTRNDHCRTEDLK